MGRRVAVIGGGAAGMMAAIQAARAQASVTLYERNDRVGKKILSTGNGKCNFSNVSMEKEVYRGSAAMLVPGLFAQFGVTETKAFFEGLGMRIRAKDGYLYPATQQASTVLDVLRFELDRLGVIIHTNCLVEEICRGQKTYSVAGQKYDGVVIACGSKAAPKTGSDGTGFSLVKELGHYIVPPLPALCGLHCRGSFWKSIAGVRCMAKVTLFAEGKIRGSDTGELQLTDYGISGIPVFQVSRYAARALYEKEKVRVELDFLPEYDDNEYSLFWRLRWERQKEQTMEKFMTGVVNKKIALCLLRMADIRMDARAKEVTAGRREGLEHLCRRFSVEVEKTNSFEQAQVCTGGVTGTEVSGELESLKAPGLFLAGEIMDIDGICGGYNLQWAWSSGAVAGMAAAGRTDGLGGL